MTTEDALMEAINTGPLNSLQRFRLKNIMRSPFRREAKARLVEACNQKLQEAQAITISGEGEDQVIEAVLGWAAIIALIIQFLPVFLDLIGRFNK
jgi:hypothetical protein